MVAAAAAGARKVPKLDEWILNKHYELAPVPTPPNISMIND
jgi:hypothetical protein